MSGTERIRRPSSDQVRLLAAHLGRDLDESQSQLYADLTDEALVSHDFVNSLYAGQQPIPVRRDFEYAATEHNPNGAWYVRTDIGGTPGGPLDGKTVAIKDSVTIAGLPMMCGSRAIEGFVPERDATSVTRLLHAGAQIVGKSVCEDLCYSGSSFTSADGPVTNPWDTSREAGGSSSGSAALVAARAVDLALGGDQGGSIRIPAAFCGIVGHKPTYGLVPYTGALPYERTIDYIGPMASSVLDTALMLTALAGVDGEDPRQPTDFELVDYAEESMRGLDGLRIGILAEGFGHTESAPEVDEIVRASALRLQEMGATVVQTSVPRHHDAFQVWKVISGVGGTYQTLLGNAYGMNVEGTYDPELMEYLGRRRRTAAVEITDLAYAVGIPGYFGITELHGATYGRARNLTPLMRRAYDDALATCDVLVMPTVPFVAGLLPTAESTRLQMIRQATGMSRNTAPFNLTGHPAISVPAGLSAGLPVGMMIVGRRFDDQMVLRVARGWEELVEGFPAPMPPTGTVSRT